MADRPLAIGIDSLVGLERLVNRGGLRGDAGRDALLQLDALVLGRLLVVVIAQREADGVERGLDAQHDEYGAIGHLRLLDAQVEHA